MLNIMRLCLGTIARLFCARRSLLLENLALRQQLAVFKCRHPRTRLTFLDKLFWVAARQICARDSDVTTIILVFWAARIGSPVHWETAAENLVNFLRNYLRTPSATGSRPRTAGPLRTLPSGEKREPWQGQSQLCSRAFQATMQPR